MKRIAILAVMAIVTSTVAVAEPQNIQSAADPNEGATITMSSYTASADGLLVVRIGSKGPSALSVRFDGQDMTRITSYEIRYFTLISSEMFYLPVSNGQTGSIEVDYGFTGTDTKAIIAATLPSVDQLDGFQVFTDGETFSDGRTGPNIAEGVFVASGESVLLSVLTDNGRGIPAESGLGHILDAHPTVPESAFHESKVLAGHLVASQAGSYALGYRNTDPLGYMDYVLIVAEFSSSTPPTPAVPSGSVLGYFLLVLLLGSAFLAAGRDRNRKG